MELAAFIGKVNVVKKQLKLSRVMSRVAPICCQMSIQGEIPNPFYPLVLKKAVKPIRPPTPRPTLRSTNPKPPSTASTPYHIKTPNPISEEEEAIMS
jgi:hypothetical protein